MRRSSASRAMSSPEPETMRTSAPGPPKLKLAAALQPVGTAGKAFVRQAGAAEKLRASAVPVAQSMHTLLVQVALLHRRRTVRLHARTRCAAAERLPQRMPRWSYGSLSSAACGSCGSSLWLTAAAVPPSQALHTEDHALLEQCLELKEAKAIKATVQRLPVQVQPYRALRLLVGKHSCKLVA